ncbi:MAG TPA: DUF6580 family putative transport protein [Verrucomicrobiae bacterium]|nr:DUF6580 family putative transport protein [Verrucomicrobiae bacterium]
MKKNILLPVLLIVVFALSRWPGLMPPNFSAAYAIVFCAGLYLPGGLGWIVPLVTMLVTDLLLDLVFYRGVGFSWGGFIAGQGPNYIAYAGLIWLGKSLGAKRPWWALVGGGILGSILFYLVTNTTSWLTLNYEKTLAGWIRALTTGFPEHPPTWEFFRNTLISGGLFTGLFVGAMKLTAESETEEEKEESTDEEPEAKPVEAES